MKELTIIEHHSCEAYSNPKGFAFVGKVMAVCPNDLGSTWYEPPFGIKNHRQIVIRV
jgi:hypothetical protein